MHLRSLAAAAFLLLIGIIPTMAATPLLNEPIAPLPRPFNLDPKRIALGKRLFNDTRLSRDDTISCATCHILKRGGADGLIRPRGINGAAGTINTPTVFNSALGFVQFWDGRAATLEEQAAGPIHNPAEMASDWNQVITKLGRDHVTIALFAKAYPDGLTVANISDAIATFERSLNTPESPFDRYLAGDENAIDAAARRGYFWFKSYGCASCHQGAAVGGNMYQTMGVVDNYFARRGHITQADLGRFNVTHDPRDRYVFKVPSLRLVALTAPYFHDGSVQSLDEAINVMATYQLGRSIPPSRRKEIAAFLRSLAGVNPELAP